MAANDEVIVEVVGVSISLGGRSCDDHNICGESVKVGDHLICRVSSTIIEGARERCVKVFKFNNGIQSCHIGFLPRYMRNSWYMFYDQECVVVEDCRKGNYVHNFNRPQRMGGILKAQVLFN